MKNKSIYIPGDLVIIDNDVCQVKGVRKRNGLIQNVVEVKVISHTEDIVRAVDESSIEPIPITPVILEANGWIYHHDVWAEKGFVVLSQNADSTWEVLYKMPKFGRPLGNTRVIESKNLLCEIRYVHQLQHLLFGLGLNSELKV